MLLLVRLLLEVLGIGRLLLELLWAGRLVLVVGSGSRPAGAVLSCRLLALVLLVLGESHLRFLGQQPFEAVVNQVAISAASFWALTLEVVDRTGALAYLMLSALASGAPT